MRIMLLILSLLLFIPGESRADNDYPERPYWVNMFVRLGHGLSNVATAPAEIYVQSAREAICGGPAGTALNEFSNGFAGAITGVGWMVARVVNGVFEIVTFPAPMIPPLMYPATTPIALEGIDESFTSPDAFATCRRRV